MAFYDRIGFQEMLRVPNGRGEPWIVCHRSPKGLCLYHFSADDRQTVVPLERTGLMHFRLMVEVIDVAELKNAGVELLRPRSSERGLDGTRGMWIEDPDGREFEVIEMATG